MLRSMPTNCVVLAGVVAHAGELRRSAKGMAYFTFSLSFPEYQRSLDTGGMQRCASFIDCIAYGRLAEDYDGELTKGRQIVVQGRLHWDKFVDGRNNYKSKHQIRVDRIDLDLDGGMREAVDDVPVS